MPPWMRLTRDVPAVPVNHHRTSVHGVSQVVRHVAEYLEGRPVVQVGQAVAGETVICILNGSVAPVGLGGYAYAQVSLAGAVLDDDPASPRECAR